MVTPTYFIIEIDLASYNYVTNFIRGMFPNFNNLRNRQATNPIFLCFKFKMGNMETISLIFVHILIPIGIVTRSVGRNTLGSFHMLGIRSAALTSATLITTGRKLSGMRPAIDVIANATSRTTV